MKKWKTLESDVVYKNPHMQVIKEKVKDFNDSERSYYLLDSNSGSVMIVPIKIDSDGTKFIMVEQYRHPVGGFQLEFPAGKRKRGELSQAAALRELKEETGYDPKWIKFMYSLFPDVGRSKHQMAVFLALVDGEPGEQKLEEAEKGADLQVKELNADEMHKLVLDNEIVSGASLAALLSVLMQGKEFTKYLNNLE